jgi:hypothetical protein
LSLLERFPQANRRRQFSISEIRSQEPLAKLRNRTEEAKNVLREGLCPCNLLFPGNEKNED